MNGGPSRQGDYHVDYLLHVFTFCNHIVHIFNHIGSETVDIQSVLVGFGWVPILIASEELSFPIRHFQGFGLYVPLASLGKPTPFWILELGLNEIM